jgi:hypothetical protein
MDLRERVSSGLKQAMKDKDAARLSTLRLITAAIKDRDIDTRGDSGDSGVSDDEVLAILGKMVKQRQESARAYEEGGRLDLAEPAGRGSGAGGGAGSGQRHRRRIDSRHGAGDGRTEGQVHRPDGFRQGRPDGQEVALHFGRGAMLT